MMTTQEAIEVVRSKVRLMIQGDAFTVAVETLCRAVEAQPALDDSRLSAILARAVSRQAETISAQADQIVSLSRSA